MKGKIIMINYEYNPKILNNFLYYLDGVLNKSSNTIKEYNYDLVSFLKFLKTDGPLKNSNNINNENIIINDITVKDLEKVDLNTLHEYLSYLKSKKNGAATRARKASSLKSFFNYLTIKTGDLQINPAQNLENPKIGKRLPKYLTLEESKKLLDNVSLTASDKNKARDYAIITLFLNCGLRLSELVSIDLKNIDFENEKINIIGKGNKERVIYLNTACINALKDYYAVRPRDIVDNNSKDALFISERKLRISQRTVQQIVKNYLNSAGLDNYSVHKLRHTAATLMYQYGQVDIRALQELLGHESLSTTEIYTHVNNNQIKNAVNSNPLSKEIAKK